MALDRPGPVEVGDPGGAGGHEPSPLGGVGADRADRRPEGRGVTVRDEPSGRSPRRTSGTPPTEVATTGTPAAIASRRTRPNASHSDGRTNADAPRITARYSAADSTWPSHVTWSAMPSRFASASRVGRSPQSCPSSTTGGRSAAGISATAWRRYVSPLFGAIRPAKRTYPWGSPGGGASAPGRDHAPRSIPGGITWTFAPGANSRKSVPSRSVSTIRASAARYAVIPNRTSWHRRNPRWRARSARSAGW